MDIYQKQIVIECGYCFHSNEPRINEYSTCKEVILRGCFHPEYEKDSAELTLFVKENVFEKVSAKWEELGFPALKGLNKRNTFDYIITFDIDFDGIFKSAAWLDVFITFLRIFGKFDDLQKGIDYLIPSYWTYQGMQEVIDFVINNVDKVAEIDNDDIIDTCHSYNGSIYNKDKFIKNG